MPDHKLVPFTMFEELEKKARAHDDYLEAMRRSRERAAQLELNDRSRPIIQHEFTHGYKTALLDLGRHIVDVGNERPVPHG